MNLDPLDPLPASLRVLYDRARDAYLTGDHKGALEIDRELQEAARAAKSPSARACASWASASIACVSWTSQPSTSAPRSISPNVPAIRQGTLGEASTVARCRAYRMRKVPASANIYGDLDCGRGIAFVTQRNPISSPLTSR